jgi:hypothetical protein
MARHNQIELPFLIGKLLPKLDDIREVEGRIVEYDRVGITAVNSRAAATEVLQPDAIYARVVVGELAPTGAEVENPVIRAQNGRDLTEEDNLLIVVREAASIHFGINPPLHCVLRLLLGEVINATGFAYRLCRNGSAFYVATVGAIVSFQTFPHLAPSPVSIVRIVRTRINRSSHGEKYLM